MDKHRHGSSKTSLQSRNSLNRVIIIDDSPARMRALHRMEVAERKTEEDTNWRSVLYDFSQNTTIHGLKQITEPTPFNIRRVLWVIILLGGIAMFTIQVIDSILHYRSRPVAVNVKINYNETLTFPAVTICNQNAFRTTVAASQGRYDLITDLFSENWRAADDVSLKNITLDDLYQSAAHNKSDVIVGCEWDNKACSHEDFETTLTDHGLCYTFNTGKNNSTLRDATQTGADRGLRLKLNIEQYEYMRGPNDGAGLKILIHSQRDQPQVRDLAQAIPPGSHAFVGIQIVQVHNLKEPYGKCDDSKTLKYFNEYTMSTCLLDCKQRYLVDKCGCIDFYMPRNKSGLPPVCDLEQYMSCLLPTIEQFNEESNEDLCQCPIPCSRTMYDPTITYGSNSNFDMDKMLRENTDLLKEKYIEARETIQRVNPSIVKEDTKLMRNFAESIKALDKSLEEIVVAMSTAMAELEAEMYRLERRIHYHWDRGLGGVDYIHYHDFSRGWEVMEERTLPYVTSSFFETVSYMSRILDETNDTLTSNTTDNETKKIMSVIMRNELLNRLDLCKRAEANLTQVDDAFKTGKPLLTYRYSRDRRYDMAYINLELLQHSPRKQEEYFGALMRSGLVRTVRGANMLLEVLDTYTATGEYNVSHYDKATYDFTKGCKTYNFRLFQYRDRIVQKPLEIIDGKQEKFKALNETLKKQRSELHLIGVHVETLIKDLKAGLWEDINKANAKCEEYLNRTQMTKTRLSEEFTSKHMSDTIQKINHFFTNLRSRSRDLTDAWVHLSHAYVDIYKNMLMETVTKAPYQMVLDDLKEMMKYPNTTEFHLKSFAHMLRTSWSHLEGTDPKDFYFLMNADLPETQWLIKHLEFRSFFNRLSVDTSIANMVRDADEEFIKATHKLVESLEKFQESNQINFDFYRENFMHLDVFMRELSYEEITQQVAYDMTNLWSDIGGSIGLFVGASALTAFEILDVFVHNVFKIHLKQIKKHTRKRSANGKDQRLPESKALTSAENRNKHNMHPMS